MQQAPVVGQRVECDRVGEQWVGTVVDPAWVEIHGQPTMALVEWVPRLGAKASPVDLGGLWSSQTEARIEPYHQIHPHHELVAVVNGARYFGPIENN
jgi:hypothetical protein